MSVSRSGLFRLDATWDLECGNWSTFVVGGILTGNGFEAYHDPDRMFDALMELRGWAWAHNAGRYDTLWFLEIARRRGIKVSVTLAGSRIVRAQVAGGPALRDSYALIPMRLKDAAGIAGGVKEETGLPCVCGKACGGYCSIKVGMDPALMRKLLGYLEGDCRVLWNVIDTLQTFAVRNDLDLRGTVGGTAWNSARAELGLPNAEWQGLGQYRAARDGYYGGRTQVFRPKVGRGMRYDIHSSYPAALTKVEVPIGSPHDLCEPEATRAYLAGREGIYRAAVVVDDEWIPPLPVRSEYRLLYPTGEIIGSWTGYELRAAESRGARVLRIRHGVVWGETSRVFASWCRRIWDLREAESKRNPSLGKWLKWLANAVTGKLAMRPEIRILSLRTDPPPACSGTPPCSPHRCSGACGRWRLIAQDQDLWSTSITRIATCGHVHWAAYLTAFARVELLDQLRHAGEGAVYCDTDSVYSSSKLTRRVGSDLGEWGYEGAMREWWALAPKLYRYRDGKGKWHVRGKGMPQLDAAGFELLADGKTWETRIGVAGLFDAARRGEGLFAPGIVKRRLHLAPGAFGDRTADGDLTRPPHYAHNVLCG